MTAPPGAIFLSYASQDAEAARRIHDALLTRRNVELAEQRGG